METNIEITRELKAKETAEGFRQLANFIEEHPEFHIPCLIEFVTCYDKQTFLLAVAALSKGGKVHKYLDSGFGCEGDNEEYKAERSFGPIKVEVSIKRKLLCRLVSPAVYDCPDSLLEMAHEYEAR